MHSLEQLIQEILSDFDLIYGVLSDAGSGGEGPEKVTLRKTKLKGGVCYQIESYHDNKVFHRNATPEEAGRLIMELLGSRLRQGVFYTRNADWQVRISKKGKPGLLKRPPSRKDAVTEHNRTKQYLIPEGVPVPWLIALGIMMPDGKVHKNKYDKFRQINRYLEFVDDCLPSVTDISPLRIVDFGCGKAYLTFALYDYLVNRNGMKAEITGLDLKEDVVEHCADLAKQFGFSGLEFKVGDIAGYQSDKAADFVISLHACDTATDAALAKAVNWGARVVLAVPCCQKELIKKFQIPGLESLLQHGILRERLGSMVTDTLRSLALEVMGYQTQIMEFIDMEHTPKNILIRGIKVRQPGGDSVRKYCDFKKTIHVEPGLENDFGNEFKTLVNAAQDID